MDYNFAKRMDGITGSAIREIFKLLENPEIISFAGGMPAQDSFPVKEVEQITEELLEKNGPGILQYGITEGWAPLKESVMEMVARHGVSREGLGVITLTGSSPGDRSGRAGVFEPRRYDLSGIADFLGRFADVSTRTRPISYRLRQMMKASYPKRLKKRPKKQKQKCCISYRLFQNPSGKTLGLARRKKVAEISARYGIVVIEDDPYCGLALQRPAGTVHQIL